MAAEERWADIPGCPGYQASDLGNIRTVDRTVICRDGSLGRVKGTMLKPQPMRHGYVEVVINLGGGQRKHRSIHSLVAETFLGPNPDGLDVMHLNGIRTDNRAANLQYGNRSENLHSTYAYGGKHGHGSLSLADVDQIRERIASGESCMKIAEDFGVCHAAIYHIRSGKTFGWYKGGALSAEYSCSA